MRSLFFLFLLVLTLSVSCKHKDNKPGSRSIDKNTLIEVNKILLEKDKKQVEDYIRRRNWEMQESPLGFWYFIVDEKEGSKVKKGDMVTLQYTESLLDSTVCHSNVGAYPKTIKTGYSEITRGLDEGLYYLSEGDSAIFIIPPFLAYGLPGDGKIIPPRATIIYQVKVLDVKHSQ